MVKSAEMPSPTAGAALRRLRLAWFLRVRPMDDRDELLALAAGLEGIDGARLATDFAGATSVHALRTDMRAARALGHLPPDRRCHQANTTSAADAGVTAAVQRGNRRPLHRHAQH
jgi:hypothetical protein